MHCGHVAGAVFTMHKAADSSARHVWFSPSGNALKWAVQRVSCLKRVLNVQHTACSTS